MCGTGTRFYLVVHPSRKMLQPIFHLLHCEKADPCNELFVNLNIQPLLVFIVRQLSLF